MGAIPFVTEWYGVDARRALEECAEQARHEDGHDGYTGTIASKDEADFRLASDATLTPADALVLAEELTHTDPYRDSDGPIGVIPVSLDRVPVELTFPLGSYPDPGYRENRPKLTTLLRAAGLIPADATVVDTAGYFTGPVDGVETFSGALVITREEPVHNGFVFFGWARH